MQCLSCSSENTTQVKETIVEGCVTYFCLDCNEFFILAENN